MAKRAAGQLFRCIIMGPPGAGKGTVSERILKHFPITHISSGDKIRDNIRGNTELGLKAKVYSNAGKLVPDELVTEIITSELEKCKNENWLLDGFPRTGPQAETLHKLAGVDAVVCLNVPFPIIVDRLGKRWVHLKSGRIYNLDFNAPKETGKDDVTGEELIQRDDDKPDTVMTRLNSYKTEQEKPVTDFYSKLGKVHTFSGNTTYEIWPQVFNYLATELDPTLPFKHYPK